MENDLQCLIMQKHAKFANKTQYIVIFFRFKLCLLHVEDISTMLR